MYVATETAGLTAINITAVICKSHTHGLMVRWFDIAEWITKTTDSNSRERDHYVTICDDKKDVTYATSASEISSLFSKIHLFSFLQCSPLLRQSDIPHQYNRYRFVLNDRVCTSWNFPIYILYAWRLFRQITYRVTPKKAWHLTCGHKHA